MVLSVMSSSPKRRVHELHSLAERIQRGDLPQEEFSLVIQLLFKTHPYYHDRNSRDAVRKCFLQMFESEALSSAYLRYLVAATKNESQKGGIAPSSAFVLLEWASVIISQISKSLEVFSAHIKDLLVAQVSLLELCIGSPHAKGSLKKSALTVVRRGLRAAFSTKNEYEAIIKTMVEGLTAKGSASTQKNALLLGVISGVCARVPKLKEVLEGLKKRIYEFYVRELIMSRTPIPQYISESLRDYFPEFTTPEEFSAELVPALDKALLRSPEVVLNGLIASLFKSLSPTIDISKALADKLLKPLLSSIKSSNVSIRNGAVLAFTTSMEKSLEGDKQAIGEITGELVNPVRTGKVTAADQRVLYATMIETLSLSDHVGGNFSANLAEIAIKEQNEAVLLKLSSAFFNSLAGELKKEIEPAKGVVDAINKGLTDKRQNFRRTWILRIGDWIWNMEETPNTVTIKFCENIMQKIVDSWTEVVTNPLPAAQTGLVTAGYVFTALALDKMAKWDNEKIALIIKKADIVKQCLATTPKPSFLLNHKVYSKLTQVDDQKWAIRALAATADNVKYEANHADAWALAFLYLLCAHNSSLEIRNQTVSALSSAYLHHPETIGKVVLNGVWQWLRKIENHEKDSAPSAAKTGGAYIGLAIHAICLSDSTAGRGLGTGATLEEEMVKNQLVNLAVVTHHELMPGVDWIRLCQKTGVDPGELASEKAARLVGEIRIYTGLSGRSSYIRGAALKSSATLAFVAPAAITPLIVQLFTDDLNPALLKGIGPQEAAIWKAPSGVAYVDVLSKPNASVRQEKSKDADTLKWEAELRAQLAQKKGAERKLTADEKTRVGEQVAKEAVVRKNVEEVNLKLSRGIGIIRCLAEGPPTAVEMWMGAAVSAALKVMEAGAGLVIGDSGVKAYLASAEHVSSRLGALRPFIGIASLRALKIRELSPEVQEEPLGVLATRLLYRLRFTGEQRPFDTVSLVYLLSFVSLILEKGGVGAAEASEEADEQIVLAIEFLSFHTESCVDPNIPRGKILKLLINSMQRYTAHYKPIKDCLLDLCRCISSSISLDEIKILVGGVISQEVNVRTAILQAIDAEIDLTDFDFSEELWLACHDELDDNIELAKSIWEENVLEVHEDSARKIIPFLEYMDKSLRAAAARSLAEAVRQFPDVFSNILDTLQDHYREKAKPILPVYDEFGMLKKVDNRDPWESRSGLALAFKELAPIFAPARLVGFCAFLIEEGPLGDRNHAVREEMIEAATAIIAAQGAAHVEELMEVFEQSLEGPDDGSELRDRINEAVIILYGALGRHLGSGDKRIPGVVDRLLATLSTPSETVQYAVAECLPPLIKASRDRAPDYLKKLLDQIFTAKAYAARRGAAYGLAGVIKGRGISALKDYRVMSTLRGAVENKKEPNARQGALFAYELLSLILGRLFEPYVIQILPLLLQSFGDGVIDVREACSDAAKVCFSSLSSYGVKVILPDLLEGLDEPAWRSKKGACETLGAMAYLAPHQLAISLPEIIPPLTTVLNDSHKEVRAAANRSLKKFGEVISNPEVKDVVDVLLKALSDPTKYTDDALDALMKVSFVHYLDAPSLALIVRILERGLGDRSATKRKASQIIGSLAHLTERKDVMVHIPILVSGLKQAIVDPVPATRATASKALGSLVEKLGEDALPDIIPGLMATLKSDTGAGDRLGSAQALSEVLSGLGTQRLEETLPTILQNANSSKPSVREGFMSLFIFLPACFGNSFSAYLSKIIPPILSGLADDIESIRETSLRAGRLLVKNFATRAIDLLLPELEGGLADNNHRIRLSSVELVGDLLFNLTGISGKSEQDDMEATGEIGSSLLEVLGKEKRDKVLSALYICRCDTSGQVRLAAVAVWKALVASPRTLKELVPTLTQLIIRRLASSSAEQKVIAGQALGELIRKAGEGVLSTLLPTLEEGLRFATDTDAKQGICIALKEVVNSTSPESLEDYETTLVSVVRTALVDADDDVREAAAEAFDALQKFIGKRIVDQVLPHLLSLLRSEDDAEHALAALLTLLTEQTRSNIILPVLIPTLLAPPISHFNARALASLAEVAGSSLNRRLPNIMNSLMDNIIACQDEELLVDLNASFDSVLLSVDEYDGLNTAMNEMLKLVKHDDHRKRAAACGHFAKFFAETDVDYSKYTQDCVRVLLISFDDRDTQVVKNAWSALNELTRKLKKEEMEALVFSTRQVLQQVGVPGVELPGFSLPKGINAILPIFLQGLMYGTPDQRTQSALAISDIIDRTNGESLRPFVTQITGPLIRVVSERSVDIKAAILLTLNSLLQKIPTYLKPFLPQLQRTFAKSLADTSSELLRTRAAKALGTLITLTPRIDPLISELVTGAKTPDPGVKDAMMKALYEVVSKAGGNMSEPSKASILSLIEDDLDQDDDRMAIAGARLLGVLVPHLSPGDSSRVIRTHAVSNAFTKASVLGLNAVLVESPASLTESPFFEETPPIISQGISHKNPFISDNCVLAAGKLLISSDLSKSFETAKSILESLTQAIKSPVSASTDTKRLALVVIRTVSRLQPEMIRPHLPLLAPVIFSSVRDMVIPVKLSAEQAFIAIFQVVQQGDAVFEKYIGTVEGPQKRSMHDYFRRVAMKLAAAERERNEAGGAGLGLNSDEEEDMKEIMSVGRADSDGWVSND
ncbi:armadillo-type protein [Tuber indicum]|nr:armadillo-type protein [Tuber indicum]